MTHDPSNIMLVDATGTPKPRPLVEPTAFWVTYQAQFRVDARSPRHAEATILRGISVASDVAPGMVTVTAQAVPLTEELMNQLATMVAGANADNTDDRSGINYGPVNGDGPDQSGPQSGSPD